MSALVVHDSPDRDTLLRDDLTYRIALHVYAHPGLTLSELRRQVGTPNWTGFWHRVNRLEAAGFVRSKRGGRTRTLFPVHDGLPPRPGPAPFQRTKPKRRTLPQPGLSWHTADSVPAGALDSLDVHLVRITNTHRLHPRFWEGIALCGKEYRTYDGAWEALPDAHPSTICAECRAQRDTQ